MSQRRRIYLLIISVFTVFTGFFVSKSYEVETIYKLNTAKKVIPVGQVVGIRAKTKGVLVIAKEDDEKELIGGIREGDYIVKIEHIEINSAKDIYEVLNYIKKDNITLTIKRDDRYINKEIEVQCDDGEYKLGFWVRDKISGVGTMTFYDYENNSFMALGHPITDIDTKSTLDINSGEIYIAEQIEVSKGKKGFVGSIQGNFDIKKSLGNFSKNLDVGINGNLDDTSFLQNNKPILVGTKENVKKGMAKVLFQDENGNNKYYDIKIEKILNTNVKNNKGMIIEVVDEELINYTGGIIQGMSGAPIIQNNKIIGAITHVLIDNPKKGYGIFIDWMIK